MKKETMTPRERWEAVLKRQRPDRVPMDYWGTAEATEKLCQYLGADWAHAMERLHIDQPLAVGPTYAGPRIANGTNEWGLRYRTISYGTGVYHEVANAPLAAYTSVAEIEKHYCWPSPDWYSVAHLPAAVKGQDHRPVRGGGSEPFLLYCQLRGLEQAFEDLVVNPEIVEYCLGKLFGLAYEGTRRIFETLPGRVLFCYVAEDLGSQQSLLMSKAHIQRFLFPGMKRMIDLAHQAGVYVFHHDDGAIRTIIPDLIELGIDILNPLQWRLPGMDREGLKRDFGTKLVFHGGMDNQTTLPFGTVQDVQAEVADNLRILGAGGGYILAPCHNVQAVSPPANIVAMYETGYELGWSR